MKLARTCGPGLVPQDLTKAPGWLGGGTLSVFRFNSVVPSADHQTRAPVGPAHGNVTLFRTVQNTGSYMFSRSTGYKVAGSKCNEKNREMLHLNFKPLPLTGELKTCPTAAHHRISQVLNCITGQSYSPFCRRNREKMIENQKSVTLD